MKATKYIRANGYKKGEPNLTLHQFIGWVKQGYGVSICEGTASAWLHKLGFAYRQFSKAIYFDGHDREDVVEDRKKYCQLMEDLKP